MKDKIDKLKSKIMADMDFRDKVLKYRGTFWDSFDICIDPKELTITIVLPTSDKDVFVFLDEDYNTIGVHRFKENEERDYRSLISNLRLQKNVPVYFDITPNHITNLASRIITRSTNHGHSREMIVNGQEVEDSCDSRYCQLLSYIVFLNDMIDDYYQRLYHETILGFDYPSLEVYLRTIVRNIDRFIDECIKEGARPWPSGILNIIGKNSDYYNELYYAIDFLLYERGYAINGNKSIEKVYPLKENIKDVYEITGDLFKLMDVPMKEVKKRVDHYYDHHRINTVNLDELLTSNNRKK